MKILMIGRGVVSIIYGWALERAGHSVEFYVRPGRKAHYGPKVGLEILDARKSLRGNRVSEDWTICMREDLPPEHDYDLIFLSVQHYHFQDAAKFLGPRAGNATVLIFNNLWVEPLEAASSLPLAQLAWGFPGAGGGFDSNGVLHGALLRKVSLGTFRTEPTPRQLDVSELFAKAGFAINEERDFRSFLFVHFAFDCAIETEALKAGSMSGAFASAESRRNTILNMRELVQLLAARSVDLRDQSAKLAPFRLPTWLLGPIIGLAPKLAAPVRVIISSHSNMEELRSTCLDVLTEARRLGIYLPRLEAASPLFER